MTTYEVQNHRLAEHLFRVSEEESPVEVGSVYLLPGCDDHYPVLLVVTLVDTGIEGIVNALPFHWQFAAVTETDLFVPRRLAGADLIVMMEEAFSIPVALLCHNTGRMPKAAMNLILDTLSFRVSWEPRNEEHRKVEDAVFGAIYAVQREVAEAVYKGDSL